ncbi:MAG: CPBP family intramembrane metalloprotease [Rhodoferax sp.]|nr:CPBP family intramembrane glutamic endopeptidase [Rhodoferax sp.]MDP3651214.1 CPBP family intramembrane metalloprotease [Rhodoferax sp.]
MKHDKLLQAFVAYLVVVYSKRFWLGDLNGLQFWLADVLCFVVIPVVLMAWSFRPVFPFKEFQKKMPHERTVGYGTLAFYAVICFLALIAVHRCSLIVAAKVMNSYPDVLPQKLSYTSKLPGGGELKFIAALYFGLTAGIVEEFLFRGVLKKLLGDYISKSNLVFVVLSAVIFGTIHWAAGLSSIVATGMAGLLLAMLYLWTKDLRPLMAGHFLLDFFIYLR